MDLEPQETTPVDFARYIDELFARTNPTTAPLSAQWWSHEMIIELYVSMALGLTDDDPQLATEVESRAKAHYWRGKLCRN